MRRRIVALWMLGLAVSMTAAADDARALSDRAREAMTKGEPKRAVELLEKLVTLQPGSAEHHYRLAVAAMAAGAEAGMFGALPMAKKAKVHLDRAVELDPELIAARFALIEYHLMAPAMMSGSEAVARQQAAEILRRDPIEGHRAFARIHTAAKEPARAREDYAQMLKTHSGSARAHSQFGVYLMTTEKNYKAAREQFEIAVSLDASHMPAWYRIGNLAALGGAPLARGEEALQKYLGHRPADGEPPLSRAWYWLGLVYEKQGRLAQAKAAFRTSLNINPHQKDVEAASRRR